MMTCTRRSWPKKCKAKLMRQETHAKWTPSHRLAGGAEPLTGKKTFANTCGISIVGARSSGCRKNCYTSRCQDAGKQHPNVGKSSPGLFFGCIRRPVLNIATPEPRPLARWAKFGQMCYVDCSSIEQDATFQFVGTPLLRTCDQGSCTPWTLCAERCQEPRNWSGGTRVKLILEGCQPCSIWRERSRGGGCGGFLPGIVREKHSDTEMKTSRLSST